VQNALPEGSTWDGTTDLPMDEASFRQIVSEIEPGAAGASASGSPAPSAPGAATGQRGAQKNGG
jgi:hypothetical protein